MIQEVNDQTPIAMLTVGQLKEILRVRTPERVISDQEDDTMEIGSDGRKYAYGLPGIMKIFNCSTTTAWRLKNSGKLGASVKQCGRLIVTDVELALDIVGRVKGGRRK